MKNELIYYYNLNPNNIRYSKQIYKFIYNNEYYSFIELSREIDLNYLYNISIELNNKGIYTHKFVINNMNSLITEINQKKYVMIKSDKEYNEKVKLDDLINFTNKTSFLINKKNTKSWYDLWCKKMDYFEYQITNIQKKFPYIKESFPYFKGLVETGICMLINDNYSNYTLSICHDRINDNTTLFELYNPLNFIIDIRIRDIAEYFKSQYDSKNLAGSIIAYLSTNTLTKDEVKLFLIRMFYPSFYFDLYEKIILKNKDDQEIKSVIDKAEIYEKTIKKIYDYIKTYIFLDIDWLN